MTSNTDSTTSTAAGLVAAHVGEAIDKALGAVEMCKEFGISYRTFYRKNASGVFRPFELSRPIGRKRWSGERVRAFLAGRARS